jgi:hypothetical protein
MVLIRRIVRNTRMACEMEREDLQIHKFSFRSRSWRSCTEIQADQTDCWSYNRWHVKLHPHKSDGCQRWSCWGVMKIGLCIRMRWSQRTCWRRNFHCRIWWSCNYEIHLQSKNMAIRVATTPASKCGWRICCQMKNFLTKSSVVYF